jgi:hypothetical protein
MKKPDAILMGPFVGELYWECGRFAPMLPRLRKIHKKKDITYIVLTREDRFDLYGKYADILVPLRVPGDYTCKTPECFRLQGLKLHGYEDLAKEFKTKYSKRFNIINHVYPNIKKPHYQNKNQYRKDKYLYKFAPRNMNYELVNNYLPKDKPLVVLAPRFRDGFKRNWRKWPEFYDLLAADKKLLNDFNFIICGKKGEYIPDAKHRFLDMNDIKLREGSSLVGILLVIMENAFFTFGSQSAIPNISLLYEVDVLEFGCQKGLHTRTYNVKNSPITFIENKKYNIEPKEIMKKLKGLLYQKKEKNDAKAQKRMVDSKRKENRRGSKAAA